MMKCQIKTTNSHYIRRHRDSSGLKRSTPHHKAQMDMDLDPCFNFAHHEILGLRRKGLAPTTHQLNPGFYSLIMDLQRR